MRNITFKESVDKKAIHDAFRRMHQQIAKKGGVLHFSMRVDEEGWFAICAEFPAIITGGADKNPREEDVFRSIIDSIKTAFDIPITPLQMEQERKDSIKVNLQREVSLSA